MFEVRRLPRPESQRVETAPGGKAPAGVGHERRDVNRQREAEDVDFGREESPESGPRRQTHPEVRHHPGLSQEPRGQDQQVRRAGQVTFEYWGLFFLLAPSIFLSHTYLRLNLAGMLTWLA